MTDETVSYAFEEARTQALLEARKRIEELELELMKTRAQMQEIRADLILALARNPQEPVSGAV